LSNIQYADDCIYIGNGGSIDYLDQVLFCSGDAAASLDFNVNNILCQLKFKYEIWGFHDQQIFDLITYGFPLYLDKPNFLPNSAVTNHGSALNFPLEVDNYFWEEINLGSIICQFPVPPLTGLHCSPPKDGTKHRIIVDLSYQSPQSHSVNVSVCKTHDVGTPLILKLPTVDTICQVLTNVGKNIKIFKVDLAQAFQQLYVDPFDIMCRI
jgi:hypothetical protein